MIQLQKNILIAIPAFVILFCTGCRKDKNDSENFEQQGKFTYNNVEYTTENALFEVYNPSRSGYVNKFGLNFYSEYIFFYTNSESYFGYGDFIHLEFNQSIFKTANLYSIANLDTISIPVEAGSIYIRYYFATYVGEYTSISAGMLKISEFHNMYQFVYQVNLVNGDIINGTFYGALLIEDYNKS